MSKKLRPHEMIARIMLSGKPVTVDDIKASFAADDKMSALMYRLSTYIYDIRKDGGIVKVKKDGRKVLSYELVNAGEFASDGTYVGKPVKATMPAKPVQAVKAENTEPEAETA